MDKKPGITILSITLYVFAGWFLLYAVWAFLYVTGVIREALQAGGVSLFGNLFDIVSFYVSGSCQYFAYALLLAAAGFVVGRQKSGAGGQRQSAGAKEMNAGVDAELDAWFTEEDRGAGGEDGGD